MIKTLLTTVVVLAISTTAQAALVWSTLYDSPSSPTTRSLRAVALSSDDSTLYTGWIQGSSTRAIRVHDASTGVVQSTLSLGSVQPNALATDDRGYVYVGVGGASPGAIRIYNADLTSDLSTTSNAASIEGVATYRDGGDYYLYLSRANGTIQRYDVTVPTTPVLDTTFGTLGTYTVAGAGQLRGIDVAGNGDIFVTQRVDAISGGGTLYKISSDLSTLSSTTSNLVRAMDVDVFGDSVYVTEYNYANSALAVFAASDLQFIETITTGISRGSSEGYANLDISSAGNIYMADQIYASNSDRVLVSSAITTIPEPSTVAILGLAGVAGLAIVRRRRQG